MVTTINPAFAPPNPLAADWRGISSISTNATNTVLYGSILGDLTGPITNVQQIAFFQCFGNMLNGITADTGYINSSGAETGANINVIGNIAANANINIGKINNINVGGDLFSNISADDVTGNIIVGGDQGAGSIVVKGSMTGNVSFAGDFNYINVAQNNGTLIGDVSGYKFGRLNAGPASLTAYYFDGNAFVDTDVFTQIKIDGGWVGGQHVMSIGRTLKPRSAPDQPLVGNRNIVFADTNLLDGLITNSIGPDQQIILNAENFTPTDENGDGVANLADFWLADVSLGFPGGGNLNANKYEPAVDEILIGPDYPGSGYAHPAAYLAPYYKALSYEIGGGAIGVAPFNFHQFTGPLGVNDIRDCSPYHTEIVAVDQCDELTKIEEVIIDHYGPVFVNGTTGQHYKIEYRPNYLGTGPGGASGWVDVSDQFMVDTIFTDSSDDSTPNRKVRIVPVNNMATGFNAPGRFRFRPMTSGDDQPDPGETDRNMVLCADVDGNPPVMYQSSMVGPDGDNPTGPSYHWYMFRVNYFLCESSMAFEGDQVNSVDMSAWLSQPFEVNADGQTDTQDFVDMADAYNN